MNTPQKITSLRKLKSALKHNHNEFFILLAGGFARSSKNIQEIDDKRYEIFHEIDGSFEIVTEQELIEITNIGRAIKNGNFYQY